MYRKIRCIIIDCIVIQDVNKLRKRITIVAGLLMILVLLFVAIQNKREPEVINSRSVGTANYSEEHINIALNKLYASDYGEIAEDLVKKCRENSFRNLKFSYDIRKLNALYGTVYLRASSFEKGDVLFSFAYIQPEIGGDYNIIDNPEHFILKIVRENR